MIIVDGHHRWSQAYTINPKCKIAAIDLPDLDDPIEALKATQFGIAAGKDKKGNEVTVIPNEIVEGKNLLKIGEADLKAYVLKNIKDSVMAVFTRFNSELDTKEKVADYIWNNIQAMRVDN